MSSIPPRSFLSFDHSPPPLFKQGVSVFSKLLFFLAFSLFLMVADARFNATNHLRSALSNVVLPFQWLASAPLKFSSHVVTYFQDTHTLQSQLKIIQAQLIQAADRSVQVEFLALENEKLRLLLDLRLHSHSASIPAEVMFVAPDPFTKKVIASKGSLQGVEVGSPVIDAHGIIGQVTRTFPATSEITLLTNKDHAIPVLNTRTGYRSVAYGDPTVFGGSLELRYMAANSDVLVGDVLTTSGIDGIYPPGIPVAHISKIEHKAESAFAKIFCIPIGKIDAATLLLIIKNTSLAGEHPLTQPDLDSALSKSKITR